MAGKFPFEERFEKDGRRIVLICEEDGGMVYLRDHEEGTFVCIRVSWKGGIEIITPVIFPRSSLQIRGVRLGHGNQYDRIQIEANFRRVNEHR